MSLVHLANVCSHLQNASRGRLGLTSIPLTKLHLKLALGLQKQGFISTVTPGGPAPPATFALETPDDDAATPSAEALSAEPWLAYPSPSNEAAEPSTPPPVPIPTNRAAQRLWLGLKYWNNTPVLSSMKLVSKPTKRIYLKHKELELVVLGRDTGNVKGLTKPGECLFITTDKGIMEIREAVEKKLGGSPLCRVF
ncbi:uncharacterized protein K452DRAFT_278544 [Aplosporella prunicola CBS 121167]|uniref:Ribosomal protein S8 n=1 Tax=Aplosporella prunicola CBS 121167 TaxID=1176127 RepID=A0A6A6B021_9PEZI|nr:uncharacterized protein K452DRAFT_278544 [Aplosporella prunicola CBS 121167]KAF2137542.1 hypothetical protein K452DRAFT_278544 [Aplosporella prunicola CBS 121167]